MAAAACGLSATQMKTRSGRDRCRDATTAGAYVPAPDEATHVRFPSGREVEIDATRTVRGTNEAGTYAFVAADTVVALVALNPPATESHLEVLEPRDFETAIGPEVDAVSDPDAWASAVFQRRVGGEAWWPFLLVAALLIIAESLLATSGNRLRSSGGAVRTPAVSQTAVSQAGVSQTIVASTAPAESPGAAP